MFDLTFFASDGIICVEKEYPLGLGSFPLVE